MTLGILLVGGGAALLVHDRSGRVSDAKKLPEVSGGNVGFLPGSGLKIPYDRLCWSESARQETPGGVDVQAVALPDTQSQTAYLQRKYGPPVSGSRQRRLLEGADTDSGTTGFFCALLARLAACFAARPPPPV